MSKELFKKKGKIEGGRSKCNRLYECVHVYKELEMQSVHSWPKVVNA